MATLTPEEADSILDQAEAEHKAASNQCQSDIRALAKVRDAGCTPFVAAYIAAKAPIMERWRQVDTTLTQAREEHQQRIDAWVTEERKRLALEALVKEGV